MKSYLLIVEQRGEGCDYTIGCGVHYQTLGAVDNHDALDKVDSILRDAFGYDRILKTAWLVEMGNHHHIDMDAFYDNMEIEKSKESAKHEEEKERRLLAELKAKYE